MWSFSGLLQAASCIIKPVAIPSDVGDVGEKGRQALFFLANDASVCEGRRAYNSAALAVSGLCTHTHTVTHFQQLGRRMVKALHRVLMNPRRRDTQLLRPFLEAL